MHDFAIPKLGKVALYGIYDIAANTGWIDLGITSYMAAFALESIRRWQQELGQSPYRDAKRSVQNSRIRMEIKALKKALFPCEL